MELLEGLGKMIHQLQDENMIPLGEMVRPEHYEQAKDMSNRCKEFFISLGEDDQQRTLIVPRPRSLSRRRLLGRSTITSKSLALSRHITAY